MKKIFTLCAMVLAFAASASAKQTLSGEWGSWGSTCVVDGMTVSFTGNWAGAGMGFWGESELNAADFDYVVFKFAEATEGDIKAWLQYDTGEVDAKGDAVLHQTADVAVPGGTKVIGLPVTGDYIENLCQICIQCPSAPAKLVFSEIYLGTEEEYQADLNGNQREVAPTKEISIEELGSGWGDSTYDAATHTITIGSDWSGKGIWFGAADYSDYAYVIVEFAEATAAQGKVVVESESGNNGDEGLFAENCLQKVAKLAPGADVIKQIYIQGPADSKYVLKKMYVATEEYVTSNAVKDIYASSGPVVEEVDKELTLTDLGSGWGGSTYDAATKTVTIGSDWSGKGWWIGDKDASAYDYVVIKFAEATATGGKVVVESQADNNGDEGLFNENCLQKVAKLAPNSDHIKQVYIQGPEGAQFKLDKAYFVSQAEVDANGLKDEYAAANAISAVRIEKAQDGKVFNLAGQRVDNNYKGVVIVNGKKMIQK